MSQDIFVVIEHLQNRVTDISYVMLAAARVLAQGSGGKVVGVLLGHNAQSLAGNLAADEIFYLDHPEFAEFTPDASHTSLAGLINEHAPRVMLLGDTSIGGDVAGRLSASLMLPLISHCLTVHVEGSTLKFVCQICGGKIMAEGEIPVPTALLMIVPGGFKPEQGQSVQSPKVTAITAPTKVDLRVALKKYIEPETGDVDISKEPLLVAIGRGIQNQDNIELADELANAIGGVVCGSRPVVDQGWLQTSRLVGKSGKAVKPKIYLAMGISGAPEHAEAITSSNTIIAINMDPVAPIFNIAQYGTTADLFDLVPVLTEQVRQAKGG